MFKSKGLMHTRCLMTFYDNFLQRKMENWNKTNYIQILYRKGFLPTLSWIFNWVVNAQQCFAVI